MRILVTGGAGFIGSHLCERLVTGGHTVTALDNLSTGRFENLENLSKEPGFKFVEGTVLNADLVSKLVASHDYVFHLAAAVGVFNIVQKPLDSLMTNIRGTENILEAAQVSNRPVLVTSSSEVYGKNVSDSLRESDDRI